MLSRQYFSVYICEQVFSQTGYFRQITVTWTKIADTRKDCKLKHELGYLGQNILKVSRKGYFGDIMEIIIII